VKTPGFSLVETLVALAVIAAMTAMLFDTLSANALLAQRLAHRREAVMLARSLLDQAVLPGAGGVRADNGQWQGLAWQVNRRPIEAGARASGPPLEQVQIVVAEAASGHRLATARTLRLRR
jgi:prepilin-type N-terminal cleavage/methylation domain-containing protein